MSMTIKMGDIVKDLMTIEVPEGCAAILFTPSGVQATGPDGVVEAIDLVDPEVLCGLPIHLRPFAEALWAIREHEEFSYKLLLAWSKNIKIGEA